MLRNSSRFAAVLSLAGALACSDRPAPTAADAAANHSTPPSPASTAAAAQAERLAREFALALRSPEFRASIKAQLDRSPFREHKLHFQRLLAADHGRALRSIARETGVAAAAVAREADRTIPLEVYLPVPEHRRTWTGDANVLVATAIGDRDAPVAFDTEGRRFLLSPDRPPTTPVIALVPVETDFTPRPASLLCLSCGGGGGGGVVDPPPGLYMTQAHFTQTFEGWLKGSPEFEVHILGQKGQTDSLTDYQCAGEHQPMPYYFDQNDLDWSGSVLLFSQAQLDSYTAAHSSQNVRAFVVEDDDEACVIKNDPERLKKVLATVDEVFKSLTAGKKTITSISKAWTYATALQKLWGAIASFINTNDELVGDAVDNALVGEYHPGFNWIVKGENNVTNGWIRLEVR